MTFLIQPPPVVVAGSPVLVTVGIQDAFGNPTRSTASVTIALGANPGGATLSGTTTSDAVGGVATFANLSLDKAGTGYTLAASSSGLAGATSGAFNVTPGSPTQLVITTQPSNVVAGNAISPALTVAIQDAFGNATQATNAVTVALAGNPSGATLSGTITSDAVGGVATFANLSLTKSGTGYTLAASSPGLSGAISSGFDVTAATLREWDLNLPVVDLTAGDAISPAPVLTARDEFGNIVTTATNTLVAALGNNPSGGQLLGTTGVQAVNGVATFSNLVLTKAGTGYSLIFSSGAQVVATTNLFNVNAAGPAQLVIASQPTNVQVGGAITPALTVGIQDAFGNATMATASVTVALGANPGGATLSGTTTVSATNGVATFANLSLDKAGTGYTLTASSSGLTGATSAPFNVILLVPTIALTPMSGHPGTQVSVDVGGFAPNAQVTISFAGLGVATLSTDGNGNASGSFLVPELTPGDARVTATDNQGHSANTTFTVN